MSITDDNRTDEQPRASEPDKPRLGSAGRPMVVRGAVMPSTDCLWATCGGSMTAHGCNLHECQACGTWFELLPPEDPGVYVGDLGEDFDRAGVTEWVM